MNRGERTIIWGGRPGDPDDGYYRRRMVLPAVGLERRGWRCRFGPDMPLLPDCVVLDGLQPGDDEVAWQFTKQGVPLVFDATAALSPSRMLSRWETECCERISRMAAAIVCDSVRPHKAEWLNGRPLTQIPDPVETADRYCQALLRLGSTRPSPPSRNNTDLLWYAEPGDENIDDELAMLLELVPLLRRRHRHCAIVAPQPLGRDLRDRIAEARDCLRLEAWSLPTQFARLQEAALVLLAGRPGFGGAAQLRRARQALAAGVPVVAASGPATDRLAPAVVLDEWERGLHQGPATLLDDIARLEHRGELPDIDSVSTAWARVFGDAIRFESPRRRTDPYHLMVFADLIGDTDLCVPLVAAAQARDDLRLTVVVSSWLVTESPRIGHQLDSLGVTPIVVDRLDVLADRQPSLDDVDALLTPVASTHNAHKRAYSLVERAKRQGIVTFCLQHGIESPGLTYFDAAPVPPIQINTDYMFVWFPPDRVPAIVPAELRSRLIHVGCNKPVPITGAPLPDSQGQRRVGVFENLHWERYSEHYRTRFEQALRACALAQPQTDFLVKPHHGGRWAALAKLGGLPRNVLIVDPKDPAWERYTAPSIITGVDAVVTTPSTVAMDAVRAGKPTAVVANDLDLPMFEPLPMLRSAHDWSAFLDSALAGGGDVAGDVFLRRSIIPGVANHRMLNFMLERLRSSIIIV